MSNATTNADLPGVVLARAIRRNIVAGSMGCMYGMIVFGFFQAGFARKLGLTDAEFGYMSAIPLLVFPARLFGSYLVEHIGRRRNWFTVTVIASRSVWLAILALPFVLKAESPFRSWLFLALLLSCYAVGVMAEPAWLSWMGDLIPEQMRARFWSRRAIYVTVVAIVPVVIIALIKDSMDPGKLQFEGFAVVFGFAVVVGVVDIIIHYSIPEPAMTRQGKTPHPFKLVAEPLKDTNFRSFLLFNAAWTFSLAIIGQFGNKYFLDVLDGRQLSIPLGPFTLVIGQYATIALVTALYTFMGIIGYSIWGTMTERYGSKPVVLLCTLFACLTPLPWLLVRQGQSFAMNLLPVVVMFIIGGLSFTGLEVSATNLFYGLSPRQNRSMYAAVNMTVVGLCGAVSPILSGYLMTLMGGMHREIVFGLNGYHLLCIITAVLRFNSRALLHRVKESSVSPAFVVRRLTEANPFLVFPNLRTLASPATEAKKIQAVRDLGLSGSKVAMTDLIAHLDDPSPKVREEAVVAIVKWADPAGLEALIGRLPHRELGLDSYAAMAIDEIGPNPVLQPLLDALARMGMDPRSARDMSRIDDTRIVQPLIDSLSHPDPRIRATAAETLGDIGDRRAGEPLSRLLRTEKSELAISSYATALSALGEISAIWQILPVMRNTQSVVNRRQLAVALGNLLGEPKVFYTYLDEECKVFGQRLGKIASQCRRLIARSENESIASHRADLLALLDAAETAYIQQDWPSCAAGIGPIMSIFTDAIFNSMRAAGKIPQDIDAASLDILEKVFLIIADDQHLGIQLWYSAVLTAERDPDFAKLTFEGCLLDAYVMELVAERVTKE